MERILGRPGPHSLRGRSVRRWHGVRMSRTGLVPEDVPIKGPTKQGELFLGFESKIGSRRNSLLVQPAATLEPDPNIRTGRPQGRKTYRFFTFPA